MLFTAFPEDQVLEDSIPSELSEVLALCFAFKKLND